MLSACEGVGRGPSVGVFPALMRGKGRETRVIQARRPTTVLSAMSLVGAIETTRSRRVADLTDGRPALAMTRPV